MEKSNATTLNRRQFVKTGVAATIGTQILTHSVFGENAPSRKLRLAAVGVGGMGMANLNSCKDEEIVALCDVDTKYSAKASEAFPNARFYNDYNDLLESESDLDGVIVATPDHTHGVITMAALRKGLNIFCQKPLTHSVYEARIVTEAARKAGVVTQMGNQGKSTETIRLLKEWVDVGAIGNVTEVYAWTDRPVGGNPWSTFPVIARPTEEPPIPEQLDWDRWLGPAPFRPYHPIYHPMSWRAFYDFGTGPLGDMGCHILDPSFYALDLGAPVEIEGASSHWEPAVAAETYPRATMVRYKFPARGNKPPVTINWSDGKLLPFRPKGISNDVELPTSGAILVGDEGVILHGSHGASDLRIYPDSVRNAFMPNRPPKTIPRVKGTHEGDWLNAIKNNTIACSNFDYGGPLTEMVLLGMIAIRVPNQRLLWDAKNMSIPNQSEANALVKPAFREGWSL